jgi:hypothetical protein
MIQSGRPILWQIMEIFAEPLMTCEHAVSRSLLDIPRDPRHRQPVVGIATAPSSRRPKPTSTAPGTGWRPANAARSREASAFASPTNGAFVTPGSGPRRGKGMSRWI